MDNKEQQTPLNTDTIQIISPVQFDRVGYYFELLDLIHKRVMQHAAQIKAEQDKQLQAEKELIMSGLVEGKTIIQEAILEIDPSAEQFMTEEAMNRGMVYGQRVKKKFDLDELNQQLENANTAIRSYGKHFPPVSEENEE